MDKWLTEGSLGLGHFRSPPVPPPTLRGHGLTSLLSASVSSSTCWSGVINLKCFDIQIEAINVYLLIYRTQVFIIWIYIWRVAVNTDPYCISQALR